MKRVERILFGGGFLLLLWCAWTATEARLYQASQRARFEKPRPRASLVPSSPASPPTVIPEGTAVGRIEIPRIGMAAVIAEGAGDSTLRHAVGHIPGTALPGGIGNVGLAGHRDSFFRPLARIRLGDEVRLTVEGGVVFVYRVVTTAVVEPADVGVLEPGTGSSVTLVTCFPFGFLGPAPRRFVVKARRVPI